MKSSIDALKNENKKLKRMVDRFDEMEQRHTILVEELGSLNSSLGVAIAGCSVTKEDLRKVKESYEKKENELTILEVKYKMKEYETVSLTSTVELLNKML